MPTYVYETIPDKNNETTVQFGVRQSMTDAPLKVHPETSQAVKRLISGGFGHIRKVDMVPPQISCGNNCKCFN